MSHTLDLKELLAAGSHFGHQTHKWNPKMKKYIYGERNGIYIIDLAKTVELAKKASDFLKKISAEGRPILFVGTKRQAAQTVRDEAEKCGAFHVTYRWLGGMLTNYQTIFMSIDKLRKVEKMKETGDFFLLTKKEQSKVEKEVVKLEKNLGGIKNMRKLPGAVVVIDPSVERIAINEAKTLNIPVVALVDTNCDPTGIDYVVPGNDDALKSVSLFISYFAEAISQGNSKSVKDGGTGTRDLSLEKEMMSKYEDDIDLTVLAEPEKIVDAETEKSEAK